MRPVLVFLGASIRGMLDSYVRMPRCLVGLRGESAFGIAELSQIRHYFISWMDNETRIYNFDSTVEPVATLRSSLVALCIIREPSRIAMTGILSSTFLHILCRF